MVKILTETFKSVLECSLINIDAFSGVYRL
jgi:hypothetical protein